MSDEIPNWRTEDDGMTEVYVPNPVWEVRIEPNSAGTGDLKLYRDDELHKTLVQDIANKDDAIDAMDAWIANNRVILTGNDNE